MSSPRPPVEEGTDAEIENLTAEFSHLAVAPLTERERQLIARMERAIERAEQAERELLQDSVSIRHCLRGSKALITTRKFLPYRSDEDSGEPTPDSTKAKAAWLKFGKDDVGSWSEDEFVNHLDTDKVNALMEKVFEGRALPAVQALFRGEVLGLEATRRRILNKVQLEAMLEKVWGILTTMTGSHWIKQYPLAKHIRIDHLRFESQPTQVPPQFENLIRFDHAFETTPVSDGGNAMNAWSMDTVGQIIGEMKMDVDGPMPWSHGGRTRNLEVEEYASLDDRFEHQKGGHKAAEPLDETFNPIEQLGSSACGSRTKYTFICTLNTMTYGYVGVRAQAVTTPVSATLAATASPRDGGVLDSASKSSPSVQRTRHFIQLTETFDWTSGEPSLPSRPEWSHWEVLIRFVLASIGTSFLDALPDSLKEVVKRPSEGSTDDDTGGNGSCALGGMDGYKSERLARAEDDGRSGECAYGEASSSALESDCYELPPFKRIYWQDLWAPLRFAIPATHPVEIECTHEQLEGDAVRLGRWRAGVVYRKWLQGRDVVVKTVSHNYPPAGEGDPSEFVSELEHERRVYEVLAIEQGKTVPKFLWHGEIIPGIVSGLVTEYAGQGFPPGYEQQRIPEELGRLALQAIRSLHSHGVMHGDVERRNFVYRERDAVTGRQAGVFILDFGQSEFRWNMREDEWARKAAAEIALVCNKFNTGGRTQNET